MNLSLMAKILWAAGFALNAALFFVLLYKRRYRVAPWFTCWIGFGLAYTLTLFVGYRLGSKPLYARLYWIGAFVDLLLQVAVVLEIARSVLRRSGRWVEGARLRLLLMGAVAPLAAFCMAWFMTPAARTRLDAWDARASLFTTILICLLFSGVAAASQQLGLRWRDYAMREGYGLIAWTLAAFFTDTLHAYWRTMGYFSAVEYARIAVFQAVSIYWTIAFWLPESAPAPLSSEAMARLEALRSRLR